MSTNRVQWFRNVLYKSTAHPADIAGKGSTRQKKFTAAEATLFVYEKKG